MADNKVEFRAELTALINKHSMERGSDTPDWILARYLEACLAAYDEAVNERNRFWGLGDPFDGAFGRNKQS